MRTYWIICCVALAAPVGAASAQYYPGYGYGYEPRAATVGESYARGYADVVRSAGYANLQNSQAAINYEEARSKYFDNRIQGTQTYFEMRRMNREYREQEKTPRLSQQDLFRVAKEGLPSRLGTSQLDPLTGEIGWPMLLQLPQFADGRQQLEALYSDRAAKHRPFRPEEYMQIQQMAGVMDETLKRDVKTLPQNEYVKAKNFLKSLAYEAGQPAS